MLLKFQNFVKKENLFTPPDRVLLAVSGGIDSVVLCELFSQSGFSFAIAHCNFHLRGEESNKDAIFVKLLAEKYHVDFYETSFDTKKYAEIQKISIQMAARDLRYNWFRKILETKNFQYLATGHHLDDNIETLFINLLRGTGVRGLRGMLPKSYKTIRPLLFATRNDIEDFCQKHQLPYREDASNKDTKYTRNKIRHNLMPLLSEINPSFQEVFQKEFTYFRQLETLLDNSLENIKRKVISKEKDFISVDLDTLKTFSPAELFLYEILSEYGFSESVVEDILQEHSTFSGKQFFSHSHRLLMDRGKLLISPFIEKPIDNPTIIQHFTESIKQPLLLYFEELDYSSSFQILPDKNIAYLDANLIQYPLTIRKWQSGDYFFPLGMTGKKKLSDFFATNHFSAFDKENTFLLFSGNNLVWVIGHRIDDRFKITENTKRILKIEVKQ